MRLIKGLVQRLLRGDFYGENSGVCPASSEGRPCLTARADIALVQLTEDKPCGFLPQRAYASSGEIDQGPK